MEAHPAHRQARRRLFRRCARREESVSARVLYLSAGPETKGATFFPIPASVYLRAEHARRRELRQQCAGGSSRAIASLRLSRSSGPSSFDWRWRPQGGRVAYNSSVVELHRFERPAGYVGFRSSICRPTLTSAVVSSRATRREVPAAAFRTERTLHRVTPIQEAKKVACLSAYPPSPSV